ncbi:MAG TPA: N-glycosylase/DNA lyase [Candidatus Omnitrophota bacterium]|nr:N-glycosylase/DNA lyase [Candidatus Omnitrophota bacterium]HQJ16289.1 N-glycosylase/DNA lyase [Candidatus Omnitrophota bacterium]
MSPASKELAALRAQYRMRRKEIAARLAEFRRTGSASDRKIFEELCFCILTPQSKALVCDRIIRGLTRSGLLFDGHACQIRPHVRHARFYRNKTGYIVAARAFLSASGSLRIKDKLDGKDPFAAREWLVKNIRGIGYKEASHFLRNIGMGEDLAILDIHILRNLERLGVIKQVPRSLTRKKYLDIEGKLREFARKTGIPTGHLDLLFWSMGTGVIFK